MRSLSACSRPRSAASSVSSKKSNTYGSLAIWRAGSESAGASSALKFDGAVLAVMRNCPACGHFSMAADIWAVLVFQKCALKGNLHSEEREVQPFPHSKCGCESWHLAHRSGRHPVRLRVTG